MFRTCSELLFMIMNHMVVHVVVIMNHMVFHMVVIIDS